MPGKIDCREFDATLPVYLEGEDVPGLAAHATECSFCHAVLADLEEIRLASRQVPLDEPPARVWANIRAAIVREGGFRKPAPGWRSWLQLPDLLPQVAPTAATALLVALAGLMLIHSRSYDSDWARIPGQRLEAAARASLIQEREVVRTVDEMEQSYRARARALDPEVEVVYQRSLESLNRSIDECRRELGNELAQEYLLTAYAQKAAMLASALEFEGR